MANKDDITFSLGLEIDKNSINKSMSETERLLSAHKTQLERSILKDFSKTLNGISVGRLFGGNKNAQYMSMRDELGSLFKSINKSSSFSQMEKVLTKVADVFAKYETGFKTGEAHIKSRNAWLNKYRNENAKAFDNIYNTSYKETRSKIESEKQRKLLAMESRLAGYNNDLSRTHEFDDVLNGFGNNANDLNTFEDKNRAYLNLLKQRNDAKKKYDKSGDIDALKEYTSADQQLKALKDQEKEKKNNAKEEKGSLIRFGKMLVTLHLIKKVLNSIKDIWKRLSNTELKVTQRDVKEKGFFGVDAYSAMHANVDRTHAVVSRGLGYMGEAAPFSMDAFDSVLKQLQDLNLKAISGQGIADDQLVISLQRLSDTLGMGFNIKDILTDPNLNLTDFLIDLMNSVEKFLPKLNSLDDIKKSLVTNDIIKALGPELANALVYNYNYNQRTGGTSTVMEQVTSKGTNAYGLIDYTEEAKKFADALASSRSALDDFKVALGGLLAPKVEKVVKQVNEITAEGTMLVNALNSKASDMNYTLLYSGVTTEGKDKEEISAWYKIQSNQERAAKKLKDASDFNSLDDVLNYAYYNPTVLASGTFGVGLEKTIGVWMGDKLAEKIKGKTFNELKASKESGELEFSDEEWSAVEDIYKYHRKNSWRSNITGLDIFNTKSWKELFGEEGNWDLMYGVSPTKYAKDRLGKDYPLFIMTLLSEENNLLHEAGMLKEGGFSYDVGNDFTNKDGWLTGSITINLNTTDNQTHKIPAYIEDGVLKAVANVPINE